MTGSYAFVVSNDAALQITFTQFLENNDVGRNILDDVTEALRRLPEEEEILGSLSSLKTDYSALKRLVEGLELVKELVLQQLDP